MKPLRNMNQVQKGNVEKPSAWDVVVGSAHNVAEFILHFFGFCAARS